MTTIDDLDLLRRYARAHAETAFAELVRRHLDLVYNTALRRVEGDAALAQDVSQQAFLALARHARALERHPTLAGWLHRTTRHLAANAVRAERARKLRERAHAMSDLVNAPDSDPAWNEIRPHLDDLIDQLDASNRDAVVRRFFSGQKLGEMGRALQVSEDAARMRVDRALERLRVLLAKRGISSTTAALGTLLTALPASAAPVGLAASVTGAVAVVAPLAAPVALVSAATLMNSTKLGVATWTAAAVLVLGGAFLTYETVSVRSQLTTLTRQQLIASQSAQRTTLAPVVAATPPAPSALAPTVRAIAPVTVQPFVPVPTSKADLEALQARERALSAEVKRDRAILQNRARVRFRFHALYPMLGLNRQQIDRFEEEASLRSLIFSELIGTPEQVELHRRAENKRLEQVVTAALGQEFVAPFRDYLLTSDLRAITGELAANTYFTDSPLTPAQADRLLRLFVEHRGPDKGYARIDADTVDWSAVLSRAGEVLTPVQVQALQAGLAARRFDIVYKQATLLPLRRPIRGL